MIRLQRVRHTEAGQPIRPAQSWFDDAAAATQVAIDEGEDHEVSNLYSHVEVKKALEELFFDKCVYCELNPTGTSAWDVEHFRPKGRVAERDEHHGYYWLAYTWENLFLSCQFCNQKRKDQPRFGDPAELPAAGKVDHFPLADETQRAMSPLEPIENESPLLLDPCSDDPETVLNFDVQGFCVEVTELDPVATNSIAYFHLNRRRLRDARIAKIEQTVAAVKALDGTVSILDRAESLLAMAEAIADLANSLGGFVDLVAEAQSNVVLNKAALETLATDTAPLAGISRRIIADPSRFSGAP
jgi:uncharacterized protein (TIGR02646 family)